MTVNDELLAVVRDRLGITWPDEAEDRRLIGFIEDGQAYLDDKTGGREDYCRPGYARALLMEYCRYARAEALEVFENNYLSMLLAARDERQVAQYGKKVCCTVSAEEQP